MRKALLTFLLPLLVLVSLYEFAQWIFGPYEHWTLWARVPIVTALFAVYGSVVWIDVRSRRRSRS